jgi:hypothetical protein
VLVTVVPERAAYVDAEPRGTEVCPQVEVGPVSAVRALDVEADPDAEAEAPWGNATKTKDAHRSARATRMLGRARAKLDDVFSIFLPFGPEAEVRLPSAGGYTVPELELSVDADAVPVDT